MSRPGDGIATIVAAGGAIGPNAATVTTNWVEYEPTPNHFGSDRFTYTLTDTEGNRSTATVQVTVEPVNDPPEAVGAIPDQALDARTAELTLDVAPYFADPDSGSLQYSAATSNPEETAVSMAGALLTVTAASAATATVTVTAADDEGLTAEQSFAFAAVDRRPREAATDTLAALGRGYLSSVRATIGRRVEGGTPQARAMVGGQQVPLGTAEAHEQVAALARAAAVPAVRDAGDAGAGIVRRRVAPAGRARRRRGVPAAGARSGRLRRPGRGASRRRLPHRVLAGAAAGVAAGVRRTNGRRDGRGMAGGMAGPMGGAIGGLGQLGMFGGRDMLQSTDVVLPLGGSADPEAGALARRRWTVFGQGDIQTFRGESAAAAGATYEGDLRSAYAGVDARLGEQWLAGVALARSFGAGSWQIDGANGRIETVMTAVHPYVQWSRGGTSIWALGGLGRGTAERFADAGGGDAADLGLSLGLVEARRQVAVVGGGIRLGLRGEVSFARLATGVGSDVLGDLDAGVHRTRAGLEASRSWSGANGLSLEPFGRVSTRYDGGAGQTGTGLELEGGTRVSGGILRIEAQARTLAMHSAAAVRREAVAASPSASARAPSGPA